MSMDARTILSGCGRLVHGVLTVGCATSHPFSRYKMYTAIGEAAGRLPDITGPVLSISRSTHLIGLLGAPETDVVEANFPDVSLTALPYADDSFGLVVSDQVFEHVAGLPSTAMAESMRVLRPGGWVLHTTCFQTAYHGPGDYWRFTAEGLAWLARHCGAQETVAAAEGHPVELLFNLMGWRRLAVPSARWHPLNLLARLNRSSYGSTVWVLARK